MNSMEYISCHSLSETWCRAFLKLATPGVNALAPTVLEYTGFESGGPVEDQVIRDVLDASLRSKGAYDCGAVSSTIFPKSLWSPGERDGAAKLVKRYLAIWPRIQARASANRRGVYFHRMIAYAPRDWREEPINQLAHIVDTYKLGNHRRSALVAHTFDATRDHTNSRQQGFPCLQQVSFEPNNEGGLAVTGYYVMQYAFERAYGNLLGLGYLAQFMGHEMGLEVSSVRCVANTLRLGNCRKSELLSLQKQLTKHMAKYETPENGA